MFKSNNPFRIFSAEYAGPSPGEWVSHKLESGNDIQYGLGGYTIQTSSEGVAYNICREENARLIAAAPKLLAALKRLDNLYGPVCGCDGEPGDLCVSCLSHEAIVAATGDY